jgi:hypothetical protein
VFLVFIFLILSALGAYLFPDLSWITVLLTSIFSVAVFRLFLFFVERGGTRQ